MNECIDYDAECPNCGHEFKIEIFDFGECEKCGKSYYHDCSDYDNWFLVWD